VSDSVAPEAVLPRLRGRFGREHYLYIPECESTQRVFKGSEPEGAVAVTDHQTVGRGRLGRHWTDTPRKSVLASVMLRPLVPMDALPELSLVAAGATAEALRRIAGVNPEVKFPNDVLVNGRKVAGLLGEARDWGVVLGIGVNVNQTADELPSDVETPPTSLFLETGRTIDRGLVLAALLARLERDYDAWVMKFE
jgi:BirA family transcriptional regulator, biotin operon repressor / biotin---[acetyl-CoA-carboxylase] ligase